MQSLWKDLRYGARTLARSPGFTIVAMLTLALGIGANAAIFSAVYRVLLHPLPYPQPEQIVSISRTGGIVPQMPARRTPAGPAPSGVGAPGAPTASGAPEMRMRRTGPGLESQANPQHGILRGPGGANGRFGNQPAPGGETAGQAPQMFFHKQVQPPAGAATRTKQTPRVFKMQPGQQAPGGAEKTEALAGRPEQPANAPIGGGASGPRQMRTMRLGSGGGPGGPGGRVGFTVFSYPDFEFLRQQSDAFEEVAAYHQTQVTLTHRGEPASLPAVVSSAALFPLLRAKPVLGRLFSEQDDREGAAPVAVIGEGLWQGRFSGAADVIGKTIELNNQAYTIVGVLPSSLTFPPFVAPAQVWLPLVSDPTPEIQSRRMERGVSYLTVLGRLKPGMTLSRANAELATLADRLGASYPVEAGRGMEATPLAKQLVENYELALLVLLAAVGLVLLIACANVANLLLARATVRERELALRLALGAGSAGIIRQMLVESLELAAAGGAAGVLVAYWAVSALAQHLPPMLREFQGVAVNGAVLGFAAAITMGAGIVMGLLPAWRLSDLRVHETLKGAGSSRGASSAKGRLREALVMLEVALAVVLLAGAGLLLRSFGKLVAVPLGFQPQGVLMAQTNLSAAGMKDPEQWKAFTRASLERLRGQPGVVSAAASTTPPMGGMRMMTSFAIVGQPLAPDEMPIADLHAVTPGYFELMRIPLLRGRTFTASDTEASAHVCVVNQALAQRYFASVDPLTQQVQTGMPPAPCQIVGVVGNVVSGSLASAPDPAIYTPFDQSPFFAPTFLVRAAANPASLSSVLAEQLRAQDPTLPVAPATLDSMLSRSLEQDRLRTTLVTLFAVLAILLAAVGISGVMGYSVSRRTREIGVRMALGATPREVLQQVVGEGLKLVGIGAAVGVVAALGLTRFLRTLLYGVSPGDTLTYVGVAVVLLLVALAACALPAMRAARVDPTVALRYE